LGAIPTAQEWFSSQQSGAYYHWKLVRLGAISGPKAGELVKGTCNWARGEYGVAGGDVTVCVSRLCPGLLLRSKQPAFTLFDGVAPPTGFAYRKGGETMVQSVQGAKALDLSGMSEPWLLCWFGEASTYKSCRLPQPPVGTEGAPLYEEWYKADLPILLVFQSAPAAVAREETSLSVKPTEADTGDGWAAKVVVLPLMGERMPRIAETAAWTKTLPNEVAERCRWWSRRLDQFPLNAVETYVAEGDAVTVQESFTYERFRTGGAGRYAPVPPMLALAQASGFPVALSGKPVDTGVVTSWGPCQAIEDAATYTVRFQGLRKYVGERTVPAEQAKEPEALRKRLESLVADVTKAGHLASFVPMTTDGGGAEYMAKPEWSSPGDGVVHMSRYLPLLSEPLRRDALAWMKSERDKFPPEQVRQTAYADGARRELYPVDSPGYLRQQTDFEKRGYRGTEDGDLFHARHGILPLENVTALAAYYESAGSTDGLEWASVQKILDPYLRRLDWASLGYASWDCRAVDAFRYGQGGVMDINRLFIALRDAVRLARLSGNRKAETQCLGLFCKTAALRYCLSGKYANYLYQTGLKELPKDPAFLLKLGRGLPPARHLNLYTDSWKSAEDDVQQIVAMDEFGTCFHETAGSFDRNALAPFRPMTPELARFLGDSRKPECAAYVKRVEHFAPDWYLRYSLTCLGSEAYALPIDTSWQVFLAKAWILGEDGKTLERCLDMPWTRLGDFYYMDKLAAAIMAYRGMSWRQDSKGNQP
jgi:hypothetical protein